MLSNQPHPHLPSEPEPTAAPPPRVLAILSCVLEKMVARNDLLQRQKSTMNGINGIIHHRGSSGKNYLKGFDGVKAPNISIPKYVERIYKYTSCSPACFVVGYVYLDRLIHKYPDSLVVSINIHRLLVTSVMVASKMLDDVHYNNAFFARVGGIANSELNRLEIELLFLLDFGIVVSSQVFETYCQHLEKEMLRTEQSTKPETYNVAVKQHRDVAAIETSSVEDHTLSSSSHDHISMD